MDRRGDQRKAGYLRALRGRHTFYWEFGHRFPWKSHMRGNAKDHSVLARHKRGRGGGNMNEAGKERATGKEKGAERKGPLHH